MDNRHRMDYHKLRRSLLKTSIALKTWNKEIFGFADRKIRELEVELNSVQQETIRDFAKESIILEKLRTHRDRWESIMREKSREVWLKEGDRNSGFFHTSLINRRSRNTIHAIKDNQNLIYDPGQIGQYFIHHFKELYKSDHPRIPQTIRDLGGNYLSQEENLELMRVPSLEEIKYVIWNLHPLKSPGSDGFLGIFFRSYWRIVMDKVVNFTQECFRLKRIPYLVNNTFIVLIPKVNHPQNFNHFRPISLCNFTYKIVAKIIAQRLSKLVDKIISPNQGAFVKGRWIAKNTVIAQEVIHKIRSHKGKKGLMAIKIDLKKAYDHLEWSFIDKALEV